MRQDTHTLGQIMTLGQTLTPSDMFYLSNARPFGLSSHQYADN